MAPTLYCVRHAQGYHNLNVANHQMPDPLLTQLGEQQCEQLHSTFPFHDKIDLIVSSPLKRTIYTALLGFDQAIKSKSLKVLALPELQETSDLPCDTGSAPEEIEREFAGKPVDLSLVKEGWNSKRGIWAPEATSIIRRAREARQWLKNRPEKNIVVVTHGGFLHYFTKDWDDRDRFAGTGWANTEFRWYLYGNPDTGPRANDDEADIFEAGESKQRRRGEDPKPLDSETKTNLKRTVTDENVSVPHEEQHLGNGNPAKAAAQNAVMQSASQKPEIQAKLKLATLENRWKENIFGAQQIAREDAY